MNRIEVAGYTAMDPVLRSLNSGTKVVNLRLGESHRYTGVDKRTVTQTNWHNLTFYNALAEQAMGFKKGAHLFVEGSLQQRKFTPRDGSERTVHEIIVQACHVIASAAKQPSSLPGSETVEPPEESEHDDIDDTWPI